MQPVAKHRWLRITDSFKHTKSWHCTATFTVSFTASSTCFLVAAGRRHSHPTTTQWVTDVDMLQLLDSNQLSPSVEGQRKRRSVRAVLRSSLRTPNERDVLALFRYAYASVTGLTAIGVAGNLSSTGSHEARRAENWGRRPWSVGEILGKGKEPNAFWTH